MQGLMEEMISEPRAAELLGKSLTESSKQASRQHHGFPLPFIIDTNVLIDLHWGEIIGQFFSLPHRFIAPDVSIDELKDPDGGPFIGYGLQQGELSRGGVLEVMTLAAHHRNIALNDLFSLALVTSTGLTLLTGDGRLRSLAAKHNVPVRGTLWVLDEMIAGNKLKTVEARRAHHKDVGEREPATDGRMSG